MKPPSRCPWAGDDPLYVRYHDEEWGVPVHDDRLLFEMLMLEGAQAGLSWITVLRKREEYRRAFSGFEPALVGALDARDEARLLGNPGIVRNRAKIASAAINARAFLATQAEHGTFDAYLWRFVDGAPIRNRPASMKDIPTKTPIAEALSKDLRRRGFKFVGPTIMYAFMQAVGMVDDHLTGCLRAKPARPRR